jgi:hypothetical protein
MIMKKNIINKAVLAFIALILFSSCRDLLETQDTTVNPNAPADASVDVLLSGSLVGLSMVHEDTDTRIAYMWAGQLAGLSRQHQGFGNYIVASSTFDLAWNNLYNTVANARLMQQKAAALKNTTAVGIAQVVEALLMTKLTVLYGDVPYSQAFDVEKYPTPAFDKQIDVYNSLLALLNTAYSNLADPLGTVNPAMEFFYGGDTDKWAAAAKTLQARLYLHLGNYAAAIASASLGISDPANDMLVPHGGTYQIDMNMNFDFFDFDRPGDTGFDAPAFLPVFMKTRLDAVPQAPDKAVRNLKTDETALWNHFFYYGAESASGLDPNTIDGMFTADAPHPILTFYENQLILAEAYARTADLPNAVAALNSVREVLATGYINGKIISPDYQALGIKYDDYLITDFLPGGIANPLTTARNQQQGLIYEILAQKYIVMLAQYEVFTDVRRAAKALPKVQLPIPPTIGTAIPQRFLYPQNEINTNPNTPNPVPDKFSKLQIFQ